MKRPDILIIYTDQQSTWSVSLLGAQDINTPNIDRIGREGAVLENFYTPCAVCTPSRGCFLTGQYPSQHGAYRNNVPLSENAETFAQVLKKEGYQTGYAGKWHLAGPGKPQWMTEGESKGFEDCRYMYNRGHWKRIDEPEQEDRPVVSPYFDGYGAEGKELSWIGDEKTYTTDWLCDKTMDFIRERDRNRPFLYMVGIPDPHTPFCVRKPYDSMFDPASLHLPDMYDRFYPEWLPEGMRCPDAAPGGNGPEEGRRRLAQYLGEVKCIDDNVGRILKCLEKEGILDNTIVVFTSDHGEYMGEHGLWGKNCLYPSCYRVPFLIRWPERIRGGLRVSELVSAVDFKDTLLRLIGLEGSWTSNGRDASGLLSGRSDRNWENRIFINGMLFEEAGVMKERYYTVFRKDGLHMMFDMEKDPGQTRNLFHKEQYRDIAEMAKRELLEHCREVGSPVLKWLSIL